MVNAVLHLRVEQTIQTTLVKEIKAIQYKSDNNTETLKEFVKFVFVSASIGMDE